MLAEQVVYCGLQMVWVSERSSSRWCLVSGAVFPQSSGSLARFSVPSFCILGCLACNRIIYLFPWWINFY